MGNGRLYAIGDIHGFHDALTRMEKALLSDGIEPARDVVVFLGDYIDRGPHSASVVSRIEDLQAQYPHWVMLRGNHEALLLDALAHGDAEPAELDRWWYQGGRETFESYGGRLSGPDPTVERLREQIPAGDRAWMAGLRTIHETSRYVFVHGGLRPGAPISETSEQERIWIREPFLGSAYDWGKIVVHGHTPVTEPVVRQNRIGIDTILRGGYLTAVELSGDYPRFISAYR